MASTAVPEQGVLAGGGAGYAGIGYCPICFFPSCGNSRRPAMKASRVAVKAATPRSRICILGLWHQGTIQAACFSGMGHEVVGVDSDTRLIESLNSAIPA